MLPKRQWLFFDPRAVFHHKINTVNIFKFFHGIGICGHEVGQITSLNAAPVFKIK